MTLYLLYYYANRSLCILSSDRILRSKNAYAFNQCILYVFLFIYLIHLANEPIENELKLIKILYTTLFCGR